MTADRFKTYTQMEKAYRRILARRTRQKHGKLLTPNGQIADTVDGSAWLGKERSDGLTPLRPIPMEGRANSGPARHLSQGLERITA